MFSAASVCLSVCVFVRTITSAATKRRMMKLGGYMHSTKISPEFEWQGQRPKVKVTGDKKRKKCGILFRSGPQGRGPVRRLENQRTLSIFINFSSTNKVKVNLSRRAPLGWPQRRPRGHVPSTPSRPGDGSCRHPGRNNSGSHL